MDQIPLIQLRSFEAAARTRCFTAAAADLFLSPSAVSHAVRKLEESLGVSLFVRKGRSVVLTRDGEALLVYVGRGFDELRRGMEAVSTLTSDSLRLHSAPSFATQYLSPRLPAFFKQYPEVRLHLFIDINYLQFQHDELDADIVYCIDPNEGCTFYPLGDETLTPLCSPALAERLKEPADLSNVPLIDNYQRQLRWSQWFSLNEVRTPCVWGPSFNRNFLAIQAAVNGLGVIMDSTRLAERELAAGTLVAPFAGISKDLRMSLHSLAVPGNTKNRRAVRKFASWLADELGIEIPPP